MKVYKDYLSGDEFFSDAYPANELFGGVVLEVKARMIKKGSDAIMIASDDVIEDDDDTPMVIDIVDSFQLKENESMTGKDLMEWAKLVMPKLKKNWVKKNMPEADGKKDDELDDDQKAKIKAFQKNCGDAVKFIKSKHDEMQYFYGQSYDPTGQMCCCYNKDGEENPTFLFFIDGFKEEKF